MVDKKRAATRDYAKEYREYQGTPEQIRNRSERNKARRLMEKKVGKAALAGKDVDHKKMIKHGGTNAAGNLRVASVKTNRGWRKGQ
jgi:hypothetical protein